MTEAPGSEFKARLREACDDRGVEWTEEHDAFADQIAAELDAWYDQRPRPDEIDYSLQWDVQ